MSISSKKIENVHDILTYLCISLTEGVSLMCDIYASALFFFSFFFSLSHHMLLTFLM